MSQVFNRRAGGASFPAPVVLWTPLNMTTVPQVYLDGQDSVVTDASGFASAISNLGALGSSGDMVQSTAGNRPQIMTAALNGKRTLRFDGVDDFLTGSTQQQKDLYRNSSGAWAFAIYSKRSADGSPTFRPFFISTVGGGSGSARFGLYAGTGAGGAQNKPNIWGRRLDADTSSNLVTTTARSGSYVMMLGIVNFSTQAAYIHIDGSVDASNLTFCASAGLSSDTESTNQLAIGAFHGGGSPADIDLASLVASKTIPAQAEIDKLFGWAAHKYGLTASLPGGHPYKTTAPTV